jgi:alkylation response protein AidB-like acyl-CoA dehydrogenase
MNNETEGFREEFRRSVRAFVKNEVSPRAEELDQHGQFPTELFARLATNGYFGLRYPEDDGGQGADFETTCVMYEELAYGSLSLAAICAMQSLMGTHFVHRHGSPQQITDYFLPAIAGDKIAAFALTEPGAGSDLGAMRTTARKTEGGWVIDGSKTWITNAPVASFFTVGARTEEGSGLQGITLFLIDADNPGLHVGRPIEKLGVRSSLTSELSLDECLVDDDAVLGAPGQAASQLREVLNRIRIMTASLAIGLARRALDDSLAYSMEREAFGKPIRDFQAIQIKLADMAVELLASELMTTDAARRVDEGTDVTARAAMTKLFATEACAMIVDEATRIFGSYGFAMEYAPQRYFRDARFLLSGGGTSELLRGIIARGLTPSEAAQ